MTREACEHFFTPDEAKPFLSASPYLFGTVRVATTDPRLQAVAEAEHNARRTGQNIVLGWKIERKYTDEEIRNAEVFRLIVPRKFEPTGKECGTEYDESKACPMCGAGRTLRSELRLDLRQLPKVGGIVCTLAGEEIVVSQKTAELLLDEKLTGFVLQPVGHRTGPFLGACNA